MKQESKQNVRVLPVFITIDPQRDSPSQLQAYLKGQSPPPLFSAKRYTQEMVIFCYSFSYNIFLVNLIIYLFERTAEFDSRIVGLTGPDAAIRQMAQEYRVYFRKVEEDGDDYLVESSHNM